MAIILRNGTRHENAIALAQRILAEHSLAELSRIDVAAITRELGVGTAKACQIAACFELGRRLAACTTADAVQLRTSADAARIAELDLSHLKKEHFMAMFLSTKNVLIRKEVIFIGSLDASIVHPREIFARALAVSAAKLIVAHNHPSGDPTPSEADRAVTAQLAKAGEMMGIPLLDHLIIGDGRYASLKDEGYLG